MSAVSRVHNLNREEFATPKTVAGYIDFGHIELSGVANARDLGGIPTKDGRRIRRRRLIRSGELLDASALDINQLHSMHDVDCVIDFRTAAECKRSPDPLPLMTGMHYIHTPAVLTTPLSNKDDKIRSASQLHKVGEHPLKAIRDLYVSALLGESGIAAYSQFLNTLCDSPTGATLWHCTQGKDRTGIAGVLIEYILGVSQDDMLSDYLATNLFVQPLVEKLKNILKARKMTRQLDATIWAFGYANTYYFATIFKTLDRNFGGIDNYLERALKITPSMRRKLQDLYLED
jgi:protein-tyrosine phosphatase